MSGISQSPGGSMEGLMTDRQAGKVTREQIAAIETPAGTMTHRPIPHIQVLDALKETLSFRHIGVVNEDLAVSHDGMRMYGMLDLESQFEGCRFSLGVRNAHDKSMRLGLTVGFRVLVCSNGAFMGDFTPIMAKHTKNFDLLAALAVGVDQMQRSFTPMVKQVEGWRASQITDERVKSIIYDAFIYGDVDAPKHLARTVGGFYFNPAYEEFAPRTMWSLQNAFTSAFKSLDAVPQFKATASLGDFFKRISAN